jgi:lysophospholipase L1-like esterase
LTVSELGEDATVQSRLAQLTSSATQAVKSNPLATAALALFIVSLVGLVAVSALAVPLTVLYVALIIFIVCSIGWVALQLVRGHAVGTRAATWTGAVLLLFGSCALAFDVVHAVDGLALVGVSFVLFGLGWLAGALRKAPLFQNWWAALAVVVVGAVALAVAAVLLTHARGNTYLSLFAVIAVAAFVVLPVGFNLVSERALTWLREGSPIERLAVGILGGGLTVAVILTLGIATSAWGKSILATAVVLVFLLAIASDTHADVAIALAALALIAAARPQTPLPETLTPGAGGSVLVALGDSYMSGEGAKRYFSGTDDRSTNECRRAPTAYAAQLAGPKERFDHVTFLACSGARTYNVIASDGNPDARPQKGENHTQIDQVSRLGPSLHPQLVIVSIGGNDAGFATLGETCLAPGHCDSQETLFDKNLPSVERALVATYASIRRAFPGVPVVAIPYPQPIADNKRCGDVSLARSERKFISRFLVDLNKRVEAAADKAGVSYLAEMQNTLADKHLQLCDPKNHHRPGIHSVDLRSVSGLASDRFNPANWLHGSLHPNASGHRAFLATFHQWLEEHPDLQDLVPGEAGKAGSVTAVADPEPPCTMSGTGDTNCQTLTRKWELQQVLNLWPWVFAVLAGLVGLWLMSLTLLMWIPSHGTPTEAPTEAPAD